MIRMFGEMLPESVTYTRPRGGMFVWLTLPDGISSMDVFERALRQQVAVLPGTPFYVDGGGQNTLRVNFSNATPDNIRTGVERLSRVIRQLQEA